MDRLYEKDVGGCTYRSQDNIQNLKILVTLNRLSSTAIGFVAGAESSDALTIINNPTTAKMSQTTNEFGQSYLENEELVIQWQKKYFSRRECDFYAVETNCVTAEDYSYHAQVDKLTKSGGRSNKRIFTYLNNDRFNENFMTLSTVTTNPNEQASKLSIKMAELHKVTNGAGTTGNLVWNANQGNSDLQLVVEKTSDEFKLHNHLISTPIQTLTIMADLTPEGETPAALYEKKLCVISFDSNGVLTITPDISKDLPYKLETSLSRDVWQYTIKNSSSSPSVMDKNKEIKSQQKTHDRQMAAIEAVIGTEFEAVQSNSLRLVIYGEIVSAQSFEYDDIHIEYLWDFSEWICSDNFALSGCTQSCKTSLHDNIERANFSHPINCDLLMNNYFKNKDDEYGIKWPKLYLHIISHDSWGRRRTEGYGVANFSQFPGSTTFIVQCWRPVGGGGNSPWNAEMRRFFIGGSPELENSAFAYIPTEFEGKKLSKHGVCCESTGSVTIRSSVMLQHEAAGDNHMVSHLRRKKLETAQRMAMGKSSADSVMGVMDAFMRARKRMQSAWESVPDHIRENAENRGRSLVQGDSWMQVLKGAKVLESKDKTE